MCRKLENQPTPHKNKLSGHESKKTHSAYNKDSCKHFLLVNRNVIARCVGRPFPFSSAKWADSMGNDGGEETNQSQVRLEGGLHGCQRRAAVAACRSHADVASDLQRTFFEHVFESKQEISEVRLF